MACSQNDCNILTGVINIYNQKYSLTSYSGGNYLIQYFCISFRINYAFFDYSTSNQYRSFKSQNFS